MNIHNVASVEQEPLTTLSPWRVIQTPAGNNHFVGWCGYEGRVSSRIIYWMPSSRIGTTQSGRKYHLPLLGAGYNQDAEYVFRAWCQINDIDINTTTDITINYADTTTNKGDLPT